MTAHFHSVALQSVSDAWPRSYTEVPFDHLFQKEGTCPPPPGFVQCVQGSNGEPYGQCQIHYLHLDQYHVAEIEQALAQFKAYELDGDEVDRDKFPLPTLGPLLDRCAVEIHYGHGVCVIRGLDPKKYILEDHSVIYLGVSSYLGGQRGVQSSRGAMLTHVVDKKTWTVPKEKRHGIHTNEPLPFHTDMGTDILALQVRECAVEGGQTCVSPIRAIYNDLMQSNPLVLHALAKPNWPIRSTRGYILSPLLEYHGGNLMFSMDPARIGPREDNRAPPLTLEQEMALVILQNVARKHQVKLDHRPGDLVYFNNWNMLHSREGYKDGESSSRHLVRLWLRNAALAWPVPDGMHLIWDCTFGRRSKKIINHSYPLIPMPAYIESKYNSGTAAFVPDDEPEDDDDCGTGNDHGGSPNGDAVEADHGTRGEPRLAKEDETKIGGLEEDLV
ncbi:hypothetical protein SCUP234_04843 [Seiridium cupressi]